MKQLRPYILTLILIVLLCPAALAKEQGLSGSLSLDYASFNEQSGAVESESSHFAQSLRLFYRKENLLMGGRLGKYSLMIGAEAMRLHATSDPTVVDEKKSRNKLLYQADILLAPLGLPFRLNLFAHDENISSLISHADIRQNVSLGSYQGMITPNIFDDIRDGTSRTFGGTLLAGIRNGSYLGNYREMLSSLPRLMIDYKQTIKRDLRRIDPIHTRSRDLAFVSLNKKDNWLHYRLYDYTDFLNPVNSSERKMIILGLIDPHLDRKWINLTNWIQLSTDLSYTRETKRLFLDHTDQVMPTHTYALNVFTNMNGTQLDVSNRSAYRRERTGEMMSERLLLPIYARFEENQNTLWRFSWETELDEQRRDITMFRDTRSHSARVMLETWKERDYGLNISSTVEQTKNLTSDINGIELSFEMNQNSARRLRKNNRTNDCSLRLASRWLEMKAVDGGTGNKFEQSIAVNYEQPVSQRWTLGMSNAASYATGDAFINNESRRISLEGGSKTLTGDRVNGDPELRNNLTLFAKHVLTRTITNSVQGNFSWLRLGDINQQNVTLDQKLVYAGRTLRGVFSNNLTTGDVETSTVNTGTTSFRTAVYAQPKWILTHHNSLLFRPNRAFETGYKFALFYEKYDNKDSQETMEFSQSAQYGFWVTNGIVRKLFEVKESFVFERMIRDTVNIQRAETTLEMTYFPTSKLFMGFSASHSVNRTAYQDDENMIIGSAWGGVNYSKFKFDINYSYGLRPENDDVQKQKESRIQVRVTKVI